MNKTFSRSAAALVLSSVLFVGCGGAKDATPETKTETTTETAQVAETTESYTFNVESVETSMKETIENHPRLRVLWQGMRSATMRNAFEDGSEYTLFAPTNSAFAKLSQDEIKTLLTDERMNVLKPMLENHVVANNYELDDFKNEKVRASGGKNLDVTADFTVNDVAVVGAIQTTNGVIYLIDDLLHYTKKN